MLALSAGAALLARMRTTGTVGMLCMGLQALVSLTLLFTFDDPVHTSWPWFQAGAISIHWSLHIDRTAVMVSSMVSLVSFAVFLYAQDFMRTECGQKRFYSLLSLFVLGMQGMVFSGNLLQFFLCWELIGLTSYLLIGFWSDRKEVPHASTTAFVMNRVGDVCFLTGLLLMISKGHLDLESLTPESASVGFLLVTGAITKSAQFPFFSWLPGAMVGPTPVSALMHAATMVAAGIFLLIRIHPILDPSVMTLVMGVGACSCAIGAVAALQATDLKKILAYSTVSQLGFMFFCLAAGSGASTVLHLITHGFFKSLLFLLAGLWLLQNSDRLQRTGWWFAAGSMAGIPLSAGFLSKEILLEEISLPLFQFTAITLTTLTVSYTTRLFWLVSKKDTFTVSSTQTQKWAFLLLMAGCTWLLLSPVPWPGMLWYLPSPYLDLTTTLVSLAAILVSAALTYKALSSGWRLRIPEPAAWDFWSEPAARLTLKISAVASVLEQALDNGINRIARVQVAFAFLTGWVDRNLVDGIVRLAGKGAWTGGGLVRSFTTGEVQRYIIWSLIALAFFIFFNIL